MKLLEIKPHVKNKIKLIPILLWSMIFFIVITLLTSRIETPFDGNDTYGFPFTFFVRFSGMCNPCPPTATEFKISYMLLDILFSVIVGLAFQPLVVKLKNRFNFRGKTLQ